MAFSRDRSDPPTRFRPSTGQIGQAAALKGLGKGRGGSKPKGGGAPSGGASGVGRLGLPEIEQAQGNNNHLIPALHHANIQDLGRDIPFGLWAVHNGYFPELAGKGREPFDWIEDGG